VVARTIPSLSRHINVPGARPRNPRTSRLTHSLSIPLYSPQTAMLCRRCS
jgi:hypothetical protein